MPTLAKKKPRKKKKVVNYEIDNCRKKKGCSLDEQSSWELMEGKTFENKAA